MISRRTFLKAAAAAALGSFAIDATGCSGEPKVNLKDYTSLNNGSVVILFKDGTKEETTIQEWLKSLKSNAPKWEAKYSADNATVIFKGTVAELSANNGFSFVKIQCKLDDKDIGKITLSGKPETFGPKDIDEGEIIIACVKVSESDTFYQTRSTTYTAHVKPKAIANVSNSIF